MISVKICGLTSESDVEMAIEAGADLVGFVVVESSPRFVPFEKAQTLIQRAADLGAEPWVVATLDVPWLDRLVEETPEIGAVQLHGKESPSALASFAKRHPLVPVIKALGVASKRDLEEVGEFEAADAFLFDAKPPKGADLPGGNGVSFDWRMLEGFDPTVGYLLSGGLNAGNVGEALRVSRPTGLDVSSGVERAPGVKDTALIAAFFHAVRAAQGEKVA